jgi:hypothetical protein
MENSKVLKFQENQKKRFKSTLSQNLAVIVAKKDFYATEILVGCSKLVRKEI